VVPAAAALVRRAVPKRKPRAAKKKEEKWYADEENEESDEADIDQPTDALADEDGDDPPWLADRPERFGAFDPTQKRVRRSDDKKRKPNLKTRLQPALNLAEGEYQLPPLSLLKEPPADTTVPAFSDDALEENARLLEAVLGDFGVRGRIVAVRPGPVVTLYELEPAAGVKSSRVISLSDDIARSMSAVAARVAVIPGRNVIGIELPNLRRETVYLRELFSAPEYEKSRAPLTLALGKTIGGEPVMADLAKMPHLLIAGTTGSGKSVALNTMILSLLYRMPPEHCRIIMIDPKMLELSVYDNIPHLLAPVVIDPKKAVVALKWAVREMEQRYGKMAKIGARGVEAFNERVKAARDKGEVLKRTVQTGFDRETGKPIYEDEVLELEPMPYIVVVVDEMADLMMISGKEIEGAVQRLAQMARAAGIHLIAATQRPSVDVITGTIKANFPTRISFQVTSKIDSRTILGEQGAEQLLGQGDMLYMMAGGRIRRVHGPFVSDSEVEDVVRFLKTQGQPDYLEAVTEEPDEDEEDSYDMYSGESGDELYDKAIAVVANERKVSTSYIQRRLQIGYNRAARLIERMEEDGMISKPNHQGKREILLPEGRQ
jgi:S-DNA-T family DNA segregation ATPase FtsK/SpoIIIE